LEQTLSGVFSIEVEYHVSGLLLHFSILEQRTLFLTSILKQTLSGFLSIEVECQITGFVLLSSISEQRAFIFVFRSVGDNRKF